MSDVTGTTEIPYLAELGLSASPFMTGPDHATFFDTPERRRILDMVLHVARHSDLVAMVSAPTGGGKSTLLREMIARAGTSIHPVVVVGNAATNGRALLAALLQSFKLVAPDEHRDGQLHQLREQLEYLQRKGFHCVLFIDDADRITGDACAELETIANLRSDGKCLLNVVLFVREPDKLPLHGPSLRHRLKRFTLEPFQPNEIKDYLAYRLNAVGGAALYAQIFRDRDVRRITRESKGIPGTVDALAQQSLLHLVARRHPTVAPPDTVSRFAGKVRIALATLAGVALVLTFVFQDELTLTWATHQATGTQQVANGTSTAADVAPSAPVETDPIAAVVATMEAPTVAATTEASAVPPANNLPTEPGVVPAPSAQADVSGAVATTDTPAIQAPASPLYQQDWLLEQNPAAYTVQIVGSPSEDDVRRALKKFDFTEVRATFTAKKNEQDWYGLVVGIYPDIDSAQQARIALPDALAKRAWVRRVRTIQGEIKPSEAGPDQTPATQEATATGRP